MQLGLAVGNPALALVEAPRAGLAGGGAANDAVTGVLGAGPRAAVLRVGGTVLVTTAGGLLLGEVRRRSGSLLAPVLLHWAINGLGELIAGRPGTAQPKPS